MARKPLPSQETLRQLLDYDPDSGALFWKERPVSMFRGPKFCATWNTRFAGKRAGYQSAEGYICVQMGRKSYKAHVLIWVLLYGSAPEHDIDHINGDRADNRAVNLRTVTRSINRRNAKMCCLNKTGVVGVYWVKQERNWQAEVTDLFGKKLFLGRFDDFDAAVDARKAAERRYGYHENHGRV